MSRAIAPPVRPRTKRVIEPFRLASGEILLARDVLGLGLSLRDDRRGTLWDLLGRMDGRRDAAALAAELRRAGRPATPAMVRRAVAELHRLGIVEGPPERGAALGRHRYARNLEFLSLVSLGTPERAEALQRRLARARVTILGVGAIGSGIAASLAAMGVGRLSLHDPDRVEASNLNRQLLYGTPDVGRRKVDVARRRLAELNPNVRVKVGTERVRGPEGLRPLLRGCDLFVLGADQPHEILHWTNDAAYATGTPWLEDSYAGGRCAVALFVPGRTPCLRCVEAHLLKGMRRDRTLEGHERFPGTVSNPVVAPTAGIAAHLGALSALYFLVGLHAPTEGALVQWNLWDFGDARVERARSRPSCPVCGRGRASARRSRRSG